jgi:hypothetical protein
LPGALDRGVVVWLDSSRSRTRGIGVQVPPNTPPHSISFGAVSETIKWTGIGVQLLGMNGDAMALLSAEENGVTAERNTNGDAKMLRLAVPCSVIKLRPGAPLAVGVETAGRFAPPDSSAAPRKHKRDALPVSAIGGGGDLTFSASGGAPEVVERPVGSNWNADPGVSWVFILSASPFH